MSHLKDFANGLFTEKTYDLAKIPRFKETICNFLSRVYHSEDVDLHDHFKEACEQLYSGDAWAELRRAAVFVLYMNSYSNNEMAMMLNVSLKTIGRDLTYVKGKVDPVWKLRKMTMEKFVKKNKKIFEPYMEEFGTRFTPK